MFKYELIGPYPFTYTNQDKDNIRKGIDLLKNKWNNELEDRDSLVAGCIIIAATIPYSLFGIRDSIFKFAFNVDKDILIDWDGDGDRSTAILHSMFRNCSFFKLLDIKIETINDYAFWKCPNLESVKITGCNQIGDRVFGECPNLEYLEFDNTLKYLGNAIFKASPNLKEIKFNGTIDEFKKLVIKNKEGIFKDSAVKRVKCFDGDYEV